MNYVCITVRWLDDRYHGQRADGEPEWPPSPLRLFQAMVAGVARHRHVVETRRDGLDWLQERQEPPNIVAPKAQPGQVFTRFVPNNDSDKQFDRQNRLTAKIVSPMLFLERSPIYYLWPLSEPIADRVRDYVRWLDEAARSIVALGWGVDMAVGRASIVSDEQAGALSGEHWSPIRETVGTGLRVPVKGTLDDLVHRHEMFLHRLGTNGFSTLTEPPPLSIYKTVEYRRAIDPTRRPIAAFSLLRLDASGFQAFDTVRRGLTVAGMTRHAAKLAGSRAGWPEPKINSFVLGHGEASGAIHTTVGAKRFAYLPLPSIENRGDGRARVVGSVRRVMLTAFADECETEIGFARRVLSGQELVDENEERPVAVLSLLPANEKVVRHYVQPAAAWATVTPVVLPGYDDPAHYRRRLKNGSDAEEQKRLLDHLSDRIDGLLRKAIVQAGFTQVLADHAELEWRKVGFWSGTDLADRYGVPDHLKRFPRYHVRIRWRDAQKNPVLIPGPICLGGGRFYGLGLFAAI